MSESKRISIVSPCFNEEGNVVPLYTRLRAVMDAHPQYRFELVFIDNASTDGTVARIRELAAQDPRVKGIVNARNFGHLRSPHHALMLAEGDAVISMAADLQDPPETLHEFIRKWEEGYRIVVGVKRHSRYSQSMQFVRDGYYQLLHRLSDVRMIPNFHGFGLYDRAVMDGVRRMRDPYPYFRGMISEIGFDVAEVPYDQVPRQFGITKNNFWTLYDLAMLGFTGYSKVPLRIATMSGFLLGAVSFVVSLLYLLVKLLFWNRFELGLAPILIGMFFLGSVQLFFVGLLGEYVGAIHTHVLGRPWVFERERINIGPGEMQEPAGPPHGG